MAFSVAKGQDRPEYGPAHRRERARWKRLVEAGEVYCSRCRGLIEPGSPWHLDHSDDDKSSYLGPAHARCNYVAAARKARRVQMAASDRKREETWSRRWF